ncbi:hypothetical protein FA15DRAFT_663584 [Coprinopsis marcescibilis]|uniref:Uncharacterized protein n=1 Tax=Coprinopsis marcescibilis TaxID=230819 RepID=A0A5C3LNA0_COPMA|nr:hypothetical protein FA15DRAFT_663584 [Coprinopsis marcescibilis]
MVKHGNKFIEEAREQLKNLQGKEISMEKLASEYPSLTDGLEDAFNKLKATYPPFIQGVGQQRSLTIDAASEMVKHNKGRREKAAKQLVKNAKKEIDRAKETEKAASDAAELIKHYKAVLKL